MGVELTIVSADGVSHAATVHPCKAPEAPILLVLPAMGAPVGYYRPFAEALAADGLGIAVLLDLRGQGRSSARAVTASVGDGLMRLTREDNAGSIDTF